MEILEIENIEPKGIMSWFKKICQIPHGSYHEEQISKWLAEQCKNLGCEVTVYPNGMIFAKQKATQGCEDWPVVLLQSHMDMVLAKTDKCDKDLLKDPIEPYYDTETGQIRAFHTSLGGDDGVGVATQLAIMSDPTVIHGPIEHLFTINEEDEPGKCLAQMEHGTITAKYYINLDGETLSELTYGGAGCSTMKYDCVVPMVDNNFEGREAYKISLTGLTGGHSGVNIIRPHINPIAFLSQCIVDFGTLNNIEVPIFKFDGGPINNSLPIFASIHVLMRPSNFEKLKRFAINQLMLVKRVAQKQEENAVLSFDKIEIPKKAYSLSDSMRILDFASLAPNKVFTNAFGENKMFSSSNLGFVCIDDGHVKLDFKVRSYIDGEIQRTVRRIASLGRILGFKDYFQQGQLFAFINDITDNHVAQIWGECYKEVTGKSIKFLAVAGGLECAVVCVNNPSMIPNTISVNTTLFNCHSPSEGFSVQDTIKLWKIIKMTLSKLKD